MKAIILAAGYGTRLRPLSDRLPKPLMPVVGQPLIRHTIMKLRQCKISAVGINAHHKDRMVREFLCCEDFAIPVTLSREEIIMGVAGGIGGFRDFLTGEDFFMVHNGDILSSIPLESMISDYGKQGPLCSMILHDEPAFNNVSVDEKDRIVDIRDTLRPPHAVRKLAYTGIAFMDADFLRHIPVGGYADLVPLLLAAVRNEPGAVRGIVVKGNAWRDIGTVAGYLDAHRDILLARKPLIDEHLVPRGAVFLGEGTRIADDVEIEGFVSAGKNCVVGKGCRLENCVLWDNSVVAQGTSVKNAVVADGMVVYEHSR